MSKADWKVLAWNSNTMNEHLREMTRSGADVVIASETKVLASEEERMSEVLQRQGWGSVWAPSRISEGGKRVCGVSILNRGGRIEALKCPADLSGYVKEGRLVAGCVHSQGLRQAVYVFGVYGYPSDQEATVQLLERLTDFVSSLGSRPCLVGGDFNISF